MFSSAVRNNIRRVAVRNIRSKSTSTVTAGSALIPTTILQRWYNVFGKSNAAYASWIIMGVLAGEAFTGTATDALWNSINHGKTYETTDWSKFVVEDDDDDEDEDEEEEGDDDDDE